MTRTSAFGVGKREGHDSSPYYDRGIAPAHTRVGREPVESPDFNELFCQSSTDMNQLPTIRSH
jgi:hypothetical protein